MTRLIFLSLITTCLLLGETGSTAALLVDPAGGTPLLASSTDDDDVAPSRPLGFPLTIFGETDPRTSVDVATNGNVNFTKDGEFKNVAMPSADVARFSALWDDLEVMPLLGDSIIEKVQPGVYYSVTWKVHTRLSPLARHVFQIVIFGQATRIGNLSFRANDIVFAYEALGTFDKGTATIGLDAGDGNSFATVPDLELAGGEARSAYAGTLLNLGGGRVVFRLQDDGTYTTPNLTNQAPVAVPDAAYGPDAVTLHVAANDTDADGDEPLVDSVTQGLFGAVVLNAGGTVTYTPGAHFGGTDSFTYTILDGLGGTATGTVSIMPFASAKGAYDGSLFPPPDDPDAPPLTADDESGHMRIVVKEAGVFDATISYPDAESLVFHGIFDSTGQYAGKVQTDPDDPSATMQVALTLEYRNGVNRITGTLDDGALELVAPRSINSPPEAHDDLVYLNGSKSLVMNVLENDSDRDPGDQLLLTIKSCTQGQAGDVTISADRRTLRYVPYRGGGADRLTYTVMDPKGLTSSAQVTVLAYSNARGTYDGLISGADPDAGVSVDNMGRLRLAIAANGAFTATISYGGWPYIVRGTFNSAGNFEGPLHLPDDVSLTLKLHLDLTEDSHQVTGSLADADGLVLSNIAVGRSRYRVRIFPAPQAGVYAVLPPIDDQSDEPGLAWARLVVNATGAATLVGKLGDGTPLAATAQVQMDGSVPIFLARKAQGTKRTGFITGTLTFADPAAKSALTGHLTWWTPPSDDGTEGDTTVGLDMVGAPYVPPRTGEMILTLPAPPLNAQLDLQDFIVTLSLGLDNKVHVDKSDPSKLTLVPQPKTGLFTGTFWEDDADTGKPVRRAFTGMILRQENRGAGVFLRKDGAVRITLGPAPSDP